jgi:hypothetical protein
MPYERKTHDLLISDELKEILESFEAESIVASLLLKKRHDKDELVDNPINFISISREDRTKISYMTQERMAQIDISEYWTSSRRFQTKPGAFISKIFKNISSKEVEKFSNLFRSQAVKPKFEFKVVSGERIRDLYYYESYAIDKGTLGASCMKHENCQKYLDIYTENKDQLQMLAMFNEHGELMGRALLWSFDSYKIMDRIYTICDEDLSFYFKQWATQNGYLYKSEQNWYNTQQFEQVGQKKQTIKLELKIKNSSFRYYPYMDTFKFQDSETGYLYNYLIDHPRMRTLCSSEGNRYEHNYLRSDGVDNVLRHQGDCNWVEYMGFYTHCNNVQWSDINDQYILTKDVKHDNVINDYIFNEEFDRFNNKELIEKRKKEIEEYDQKRKDKLKGKESNLAIDIISRITSAQSVADLSTEEIAELYGQLRNVNTEQTDSFSW